MNSWFSLLQWSRIIFFRKKKIHWKLLTRFLFVICNMNLSDTLSQWKLRFLCFPMWLIFFLFKPNKYSVQYVHNLKSNDVEISTNFENPDNASVQAKTKSYICFLHTQNHLKLCAITSLPNVLPNNVYSHSVLLFFFFLSLFLFVFKRKLYCLMQRTINFLEESYTLVSQITNSFGQATCFWTGFCD